MIYGHFDKDGGRQWRSAISQAARCIGFFLALTSPGVICRVWRRELARVFSTGRTPGKPSSQGLSGPFASQEMPRLPIWTQTFVLRSSCICSVRACRPHTRQSQRVNPAPTCPTLNAPPGFLKEGSPITCVPVGSALAALQLNGAVARLHAGSLARERRREWEARCSSPADWGQYRRRRSLVGTGEEYRASGAFLTQSNCSGHYPEHQVMGDQVSPAGLAWARAGERLQRLASGRRSPSSTG